MGNLKYLIDQEQLVHTPGRLLSVSSSRYEGDWKSIPHTHSFAELFYVKAGEGSFLVEEKSFPIHAGDLIIVNPSVMHTETSLTAKPLEYISIGVENLRFTFHNRKDYLLFASHSVPWNLTGYFVSILNEASSGALGNELVCQNLLEILTIQLMRFTDSAFSMVPIENPNRSLSHIKRYLDSNYQDDITLDSLAQMAHLNKYYFSHTFKKLYGQSPINYLTDRRIQISQDLLVSSDFRISEIARLCGFSSLSYFSQCFRKACGMSAQAYRQLHLKQDSDL